VISVKIDNTNPPHVIKAYTNQKRAEEIMKKQNGPAADAVEISSQARELQELRAKLDEIPDNREEKVEIIKRELAQGEYRVDLDQLADNLVQEIQPQKIINKGQ